MSHRIALALVLLLIACKSERRRADAPRTADASSPTTSVALEVPPPPPPPPGTFDEPSGWVVRDFTAPDEVVRGPFTMRVPADARVRPAPAPMAGTVLISSVDLTYHFQIASTGEDYQRGHLARDAEHLAGFVRRDEYADGYVMVRELPTGDHWVATIHGRIACDAPTTPPSEVDAVVAACRSATEFRNSSVAWPNTDASEQLTPVQVEACSRLHVIMSRCGYHVAGELIEQFYRSPDTTAVSLADARTACIAHARESAAYSIEQPPVPLLPLVDVARLEAAAAGGCERLSDVYGNRYGGIAEVPH